MGAWPCEDRLSARRQESHCLWLSLKVIGSDALALLSTLVTNTCSYMGSDALFWPPQAHGADN